MESESSLARILRLLDEHLLDEAADLASTLELSREELQQSDEISRISRALLNGIKIENQNRRRAIKYIQALVDSRIVSVLNVDDAKFGAHEAKVIFEAINQELQASINNILSSLPCQYSKASQNVQDEKTILKFLIGCLESISTTSQSLLMSQLLWAYEELFGVVSPILRYTQVFSRINNITQKEVAELIQRLTELYENALTIFNGLLDGLGNVDPDTFQETSDPNNEIDAMNSAIMLCHDVCKIETQDFNLMNSSWKGMMKVVIRCRSIFTNRFDPIPIAMTALRNVTNQLHTCIVLLCQSSEKQGQAQPRASTPEFVRSWKVARFFVTVLVSITKCYGEGITRGRSVFFSEYFYCYGLLHPYSRKFCFHSDDLEELRSASNTFFKIFAQILLDETTTIGVPSFLQHIMFSKELPTELVNIPLLSLSGGTLSQEDYLRVGRLRVLAKMMEESSMFRAEIVEVISGSIWNIETLLIDCLPLMLLDFKDTFDNLFGSCCRGMIQLVQLVDGQHVGEVHDYLIQALFHPHPVYHALVATIWSYMMKTSSDLVQTQFVRALVRLITSIEQSSLLYGDNVVRTSTFFALLTVGSILQYLPTHLKILLTRSVFEHPAECVRTLAYIAIPASLLDASYQAELASNHFPKLLGILQQARTSTDRSANEGTYWALLGLHGLLSDATIREQSTYITLKERQTALSLVMELIKEGRLPSPHIGVLFEIALLLRKCFSIRNFLELLQSAFHLLPTHLHVQVASLSLFVACSGLSMSALGPYVDTIIGLMQQIIHSSLQSPDWFLRTEGLKAFAQFAKTTTTMTQKLDSFFPAQMKDTVVRFLCGQPCEAQDVDYALILEQETSSIIKVTKKPQEDSLGEFALNDEDVLSLFMHDAETSVLYTEAANKIEKAIEGLDDLSTDIRTRILECVKMLREYPEKMQ